MDVTVICLLALCAAPFLEHAAAAFQKKKHHQYFRNEE
jgi:hypothetical protein